MLERPLKVRTGAEGSRIALGQTRRGRYLRVIHVPDPEPDSVFVITAYELGPESEARLVEAPEEETMSENGNYPTGWDEERVCGALDRYERQSDDEAVAEDEAAFEPTTNTAMQVPVKLAPDVRELIAKRVRAA